MIYCTNADYEGPSLLNITLKFLKHLGLIKKIRSILPDVFINTSFRASYQILTFSDPLYAVQFKDY